MESIKLSERLRQVADYIPNGSRLLDVGSDHAYLPIYLMQKERLVSAIAGEVVDGPYQSALANVKAHGFEDVISVRLANGLEAMEMSDDLDVITICGMGGRLIAEILGAGKAKLASVTRLVLQPNNREDELRVWLQDNGFQIMAETILEENNKRYEILVVEHGQMTLSDKEVVFGPFLMANQSPVFVKKWQRELGKLTEALSHIPLEHEAQRHVLETKIKQIREVLDES